jgi:phage/plasmid-associated DNA primase
VSADATTNATELYTAYVQWYARADKSGEACSQSKFGPSMERKGFKKEKKRTGVVYYGIKPLSAWKLADREDAE